MPYISTEALVGGALLVILAVGYQFFSPSASSSGSAGGKGKKNKKRKNNNNNSSSIKAAGDVVEAASAAGDLLGGEKVKKGKRKGGAGAGSVPVDKSPSPSTSSGNNKTAIHPEISQTVDPSAPTSFASVASHAAADTSSTSASASGAEGKSKAKGKPKTLAEKIAPKPQKTKVDDMLAPEDKPATHARVMKIADPNAAPLASTQGATPAAGTGVNGSHKSTSNSSSSGKVSRFEEDYVEGSDDGEGTTSGAGTIEGEDDGWDVVVSKKKPISLKSSSSAFTNGQPGSQPSHNQPGGPEVDSKHQRKNAKKAEAKKAAKAQEEEDRQRRLRMHKREQEKEKINEIYSSGQKKSKVAAGAKATFDNNGKLIWD